MGGDPQEPETKPVWKDYYELLHDEISSCQTQIIAALQARRYENAERFEINGKRASFEEIRKASDILSDKNQAPRYEAKLWKHSSYVVRSDIKHAEQLLEKLQKIFTGVKILKRPPGMDEWMKKFE